MSGLILPNEVNDAAGRELLKTMSEFMNAWVQRFPALAGQAARGFKIRVTLSDGTAWEATGGAAPMPIHPGVGLKP